MNRNIQDILSDYWNCAYQQGLEHRKHDDENGTAQKLEDELQEFVQSAGKEKADSFREGMVAAAGIVKGFVSENNADVLVTDMTLESAINAILAASHGTTFTERADIGVLVTSEPAPSLRCKVCKWEGDKLHHTGCLSLGDDWYVCPKCGADTANIERIGVVASEPAKVPEVCK